MHRKELLYINFSRESPSDFLHTEERGLSVLWVLPHHKSWPRRSFALFKKKTREVESTDNRKKNKKKNENRIIINSEAFRKREENPEGHLGYQ